MQILKSVRATKYGSLLLLLVLACGDEEDAPPTEPPSPCGPHGVLHGGVGVDPHCHCEDGYLEENGTCVEAPVEMTRPPGVLDCGEHGQQVGDGCDCHDGYAQNGAGDDRTCVVIPACVGPNDAHEPNDKRDESTIMSTVVAPVYACPAESDWYIFLVKAEDVVTLRIEPEAAELGLELKVYGPSSLEPMATATIEGGTPGEASYTALEDGIGRAHVTSHGIAEGAYSIALDLDRDAPPACGGPGASCSQPSDCCSGHCHIGHCH